MKNIKRILSLLLAFCLIVACFTGCKDKGDSTNSGKTVDYVANTNLDMNSDTKKQEVTVISLKGPMDFNKYNNLNNYLCLYEYTPNSIRTVVKYLKKELTPKGKLTIKL